ncbi:flagellar cap protein FliD [Geobacillus sp. 47C-IIb]|uniref:flagellar hook-associated protein 2 n=1 Tax=Geobacillus sp. 47C-IIb TaxID=1963026 RepID=UPI0009BDBBD6|nr:flagellar hook-associated protein 2 [Geobacillus sp. 47C-IIb]OQP09137.1 flagellar cap protein FliD [Geobacillus sp. 47C-IIb]QNU32568.1 flagellar hook-associated protein 2 [Geobacillus sp. 47C-IIb]
MAGNLRISGLASGMDIDQIVKDLMRAERMPLDKLYQKKQLLEWQRDDYRAMNTLLQGLDDYLFSNITLQSSMLKKTISSSNEAVVTATASASAANVATTIQVDQVATSAVWLSDEGVDKESFSVDADTTLTIKVTNGDGSTNTVEMTVKQGTTLDGLIAQLNSNANLGVSAFYDEQTGRISIMKKETGAQASLVLDDEETANFFAEKLGFTGAAAEQELTGKTEGQDAQVTINGLKSSRSSNTFTINGVTYTVKGTGTATVSVETDVDAMVNVIKGFVDKYNEVIAKINAELKEERYRSYPPLTDEQKEAMTEKQIELWEEKARSGMLRGDSILSSALSQMRMDLYTKVEGANIPSGLSQLAQLGITTSSNYLDGGKLIIDETKLREKIKENPEAVYQLFNQNGTTDAEKGIARRLRDTIKETIGKIEQKAGKALWTNQQFAIGRELIQINNQMDRFEDRLKLIEDRYYRQFMAMEEAIQRANQQSMYLMNAFFGGMQG